MTGRWSASGNWVGNIAPTGLNPLDTLTFGGDVGSSGVPTIYTATNDITSIPFQLNQLILQATDLAGSGNDNILAGREVRPEQWVFDQALARSLGQAPLSEEFETYKAALALNPQWGMHFGVHLSTLEKWEAAVARLAELEVHAPALKGRARLLKVFRPEDPDQRAPLYQAFLWTDVIASGSLALGQRIELSALAV